MALKKPEDDGRHPLPEERPDFPADDVDDGNGGGGGGTVVPPKPRTWWQKHGITVIGLGLIFGLTLTIILIGLLSK
jgi:hypothetical protein